MLAWELTLAGIGLLAGGVGGFLSGYASYKIAKKKNEEKNGKPKEGEK